MASNLKLFDGKSIKSMAPWDVDDNEGWTSISGNKSTSADYYKFIPTLYRAVELRANSVSTMPFQLMKGKEVYDESAAWENKVGFMPNPTTVLQLIERALIMYGKAYLFRDRSVAATKKLHYHLPNSVTPQFNKMTGEIEYFERYVNNVPKKFKPEDYIYFWLVDPDVEVGPPNSYPATAAANACGVLKGIDVFAADFFEHGAIKAMLLQVEGMPNEAEREKLLSRWNKFLSGIGNAFRAFIINASAVKPVVVGEGMKELENVTIGSEKREDISIAVGIPMSILFANAANYATSQQDELNYLNKTIIPECEFISSVLNEQLWEPLGLHMDFLPETLDAMQEDETSRAQALAQLTNAGVSLLMAMDILGYELTDEQRAELEQAEADKKARAEELRKQMAAQPEQPTAGQEGNAPQNTEEKPTQANVPPQNAKMLSDMQRWQRKALNSLGRGKSADVNFETTTIPADILLHIHTSLAGCATADEVRVVFADAAKDGETMTPPPVYGDGMMMLAMEIRRANDLLERAE